MTRRFNREFAHPSVRRARTWNCVAERIEQALFPGVPAAEPLLLGGK
jgi:hypothetical protein